MLQEIDTKTPKAIIIKALYSKLLGLQSSDSESSLALGDSSENLNQLLSRYFLHYGHSPGLNGVEDLKQLRKEFTIALRHKEDQYKLCLDVAKQTLEKGIPYVTFGVSPQARMLKSVCKEVIVEVNRAKSLRFISHPQDYSIFWAEYNIHHNTGDLILKYFARRYPSRILIIYSRRSVHWIKEDQVFCQDSEKFSLASIDKRFDEPLLRAAR